MIVGFKIQTAFLGLNPKILRIPFSTQTPTSLFTQGKKSQPAQRDYNSFFESLVGGW